MTAAPAPAQPITTVIITQDQAEALPACIAACKPFSDEILVVDGGSRDDTRAVAERMGCRVRTNAWPGYAAQRNFGAAAAANDWIFTVDTDEIVDEQLANALARLRTQALVGEAAFSIVRVNQFMGSWLRGATEAKVRLYDRRRCTFADVVVHESIEVRDGRVGRLPGTIRHFNHGDLDDATKRLNLYTGLEAHAAAETRGMRPHRLLLRPAARFGQRYLLQRGFRSGWRGLFWALHWSYWELLREMKVYELRRDQR